MTKAAMAPVSKPIRPRSALPIVLNSAAPMTPPIVADASNIEIHLKNLDARLAHTCVAVRCE